MLNEIISLMKVSNVLQGRQIYISPFVGARWYPCRGYFLHFFVFLPLKNRNLQVRLVSFFLLQNFGLLRFFSDPVSLDPHGVKDSMSDCHAHGPQFKLQSFAIFSFLPPFCSFLANSNFFSMVPYFFGHTFPPWHKNQEIL